MNYSSNGTLFKRKLTININGQILNLKKSNVMGILNVTPDSFYDGGKYNSIENAILRAEKIIKEGAQIIDIGAVSTRPGSIPVSEKEELKRLLPVVKLIKKKFPDIILSVDTFRSQVVKELFKEIGSFIVNDISGGSLDSSMYRTVGDLSLPYILMHIKGTPENMQDNPQYSDLIPEIIKYFSEKIQLLKESGVKDIILDPGFGFGKTIEHNYKILNNLDEFKILEIPILVGISRKSMIYRALDSNPESILPATSLLHGLALERGANILRVHDVEEAVEAIKLIDLLNIKSKQ